MVSSACKRLMAAHQGYNNFHNETAFAERLLEITSQGLFRIRQRKISLKPLLHAPWVTRMGPRLVVSPTIWQWSVAFRPVKLACSLFF